MSKSFREESPDTTPLWEFDLPGILTLSYRYLREVAD